MSPKPSDGSSGVLFKMIYCNLTEECFCKLVSNVVMLQPLEFLKGFHFVHKFHVLEGYYVCELLTIFVVVND